MTTIPVNKNWPLNTYTAVTWTDLVAEPATLASIIVSNTTASAISGSIRLELSGASLVEVLPLQGIPAYTSYTLDVKSINVIDLQKIQIYGSTTGLNFLASGVI